MSPPGSAFSSPSNIFRLSGLYLFGFLYVRPFVILFVLLTSDTRASGLQRHCKASAVLISVSELEWFRVLCVDGIYLFRTAVIIFAEAAFCSRGSAGGEVALHVEIVCFCEGICCLSLFAFPFSSDSFYFCIHLFYEILSRFPFFSQKLSRSLI